MAFATSNLTVGRSGDAWETRGTWTGNVGDAAGTVKVPGAQILRADFNVNLSSGGPVTPVAWSASGTLPVTVTLGPYNANVTAGTFCILSK